MGLTCCYCTDSYDNRYEKGAQVVRATMRGIAIAAADRVGCVICTLCAAMDRW